MTEFTKDDIEHYRKQYALWTSRRQTTPEELHLIGRLRDALDHIEHLQQRIAELEQERRWIPVSERLPEDSRIYDVAIAGYEYSWTGSFVFGKWIGETGKPLLGVTHWKYRPQIPEEEE